MSYFLILLVLLMGLLARSKLIALAAAILLLIRLFNFKEIFKIISDKGINLGLLLLIITVLVPLASGQVTIKDLKETVTSIPGIVAIVGGLFATKLNGMGIDLLKIEPHLIIGMIVGSIIGIIFWGGVPVGPLMAGGLTALLMKIIGIFG